MQTTKAINNKIIQEKIEKLKKEFRNKFQSKDYEKSL